MNDQMNMVELTNVLEPLIRRIIREELAQLIPNAPAIFQLTPDTPLYEDMEAIAERKKQGKIKIYSHQEVWGEQL